MCQAPVRTDTHVKRKFIQPTRRRATKTFRYIQNFWPSSSKQSPAPVGRLPPSCLFVLARSFRRSVCVVEGATHLPALFSERPDSQVLRSQRPPTATSVTAHSRGQTRSACVFMAASAAADGASTSNDRLANLLKRSIAR